jgi:hypothetical protein
MKKMKFCAVVCIAGIALVAFPMENAQAWKRQRINEAVPQIGLNQALIMFVEADDILGAKHCIDAGADVNVSESHGDIPLITAACSNNEPMVQLLLDHGAIVDMKDKNDFTALNAAAFYGYESVIRVLLEYEMHNNDNHNFQMSLLHACFKGHEAAVRALIACKVFNSTPSNTQLQKSQKRIYAALCALNRACPALPREIRYYILQADAKLRKDVENCAFACHRGQHNRVPFLPLATVRSLLKNGLLSETLTVNALKKYQLECIKPYLLQVLNYTVKDEFKVLFDPNHVEKICADEIEIQICKRLGLPERASMDESSDER